MSSSPLSDATNLSWWPILLFIGLIAVCVIFTMMIAYCDDDTMPENAPYYADIAFVQN
uniref:Uncharacterized protein n=1 Tax=viral metagenome TaxID=1070528 RepID=A0A6C0C702_9ZZZZ